MTVYAITDTKKGEQGLRLLIFKLPKNSNSNYNNILFLALATLTAARSPLAIR